MLIQRSEPQTGLNAATAHENQVHGSLVLASPQRMRCRTAACARAKRAERLQRLKEAATSARERLRWASGGRRRESETCLCAPVVRKKRETAAKSFAGSTSVLQDASLVCVRIGKIGKTPRTHYSRSKEIATQRLDAALSRLSAVLSALGRRYSSQSIAPIARVLHAPREHANDRPARHVKRTTGRHLEASR